MHAPSTPEILSTPPLQQKRSRGPITKVVIGLVLIFVVLAGIKFLQIFTLVSAGKKMLPPPTTVTSAKVEKADWEPVLTAVG